MSYLRPHSNAYKNSAPCVEPSNEWICKRLRDLAHQCSNSDRKWSYLKAVQSVRLYPIEIKSAREAEMLRGIGTVIAREIIAGMPVQTSKENSADSGPNRLENVQNIHCNDTSSNIDIDKMNNMKRARVDDRYIPEKGKGPWSILLSIYRLGGTPSKKSEMIAAAALLSEEGLPITTLDECWHGAIKILRNKELIVNENGLIELTDKGLQLTEQIVNSLALKWPKITPSTRSDVPSIAVDNLPKVLSINKTTEWEISDDADFPSSLINSPAIIPGDISCVGEVVENSQNNPYGGNLLESSPRPVIRPCINSTPEVLRMAPLRCTGRLHMIEPLQSHTFVTTNGTTRIAMIDLTQGPSGNDIDHTRSSSSYEVTHADIIGLDQDSDSLTSIASESRTSTSDQTYQHSQGTTLPRELFQLQSMSLFAQVTSRTIQTHSTVLSARSVNEKEIVLPLTSTYSEQASTISSLTQPTQSISSKDDSSDDLSHLDLRPQGTCRGAGKERMQSNMLDYISCTTSKQDTAVSNARMALDPCNADVILLVDMREKKDVQESVLGKLLSEGFYCEIGTLAVGDFAWVARPRSVVGAVKKSSADVILDCVVERKTNEDLCSSICDGRYIEQKRRLRDCGLRVKLYLIEGKLVGSERNNVSSASLHTAVAAIQVGSGISVMRTRNLDHTATNLLHLHKQVIRRFRRRDITNQLTPLVEFNNHNAKLKASTAGELFAMQLKQVPGIAAAGAEALALRYGTLPAFLSIFRDSSEGVVTRELASLERSGGTGKKIGSTTASFLWKWLSRTN